MVNFSLSIRKKIIYLSIFITIVIFSCFMLINNIQSKSFKLDITEISNNLSYLDSSLTTPLDKSVEDAAILKFIDFYSDYSIYNIEEKIDSLYAEDIYFVDPLHAVREIKNVKEYFIKMAEPIELCTFDVTNIFISSNTASTSNDYFARWNMYLISKAAPNKKITASGITHFKLNEDGKISFHQDFWDTSALLDELPVVGFWSKLVKNKILGNINEK